MCTHITEKGSACSICMKKDNEKRSYLRSRGYNYLRSLKFGAAKVFYNQCQLFEHMKLHSLSAIDVSDIMLMPLPADLSCNDWTTEQEIACEALMEHTFLLRVHIMDWLRLNKVINNWWKLINDNDNIISKVMKGYKGRQMFKTFEKSEEDQDLNSDVANMDKNSYDMEFIDTTFKDKDKNNHSAHDASDKNVLENEDNPCMSTDIAFVDCGSISKCFEPESSMSYASTQKQVSVLKKSRLNSHSTDRKNCKRKNIALKDLNLTEKDMILENITTVKVGVQDLNKKTISKQLSKNSSQQRKTKQSFAKKTAGNSISKPIIETDIVSILDNPIQVEVPFSAENAKLHKENSDHLEHSLQTSIGTCDPKILTSQSSKKTNIKSIISELSPQLTSNNEKVLEQNLERLIPIRNKDVIISKKHKSMSVYSNADISTLLQKKQLTGKFLIKDGKKYIIKNSGVIVKDLENSSNLPITINISKSTKQLAPEQNISTSASTNSGEAENTSMEQATSPHNDISFLTPSPSPSELSSGSSCESHAKQTLKGKLQKVPPRLISLDEKNLHEVITLVKEENGENLCMSIKLFDNENVSREKYEECTTYRKKMVDEFYRMNKSELMERLNHLKGTSEEIRKTMNFATNSIVKEKIKVVVALQMILEDCIRKCDKKAQDKKNDDVILNKWKWETDSHQRCPSCRKPLKPESYIAGFSNLSKDDDKYCYCYKYVCHECRSYYGASSRFVAHQNYHMKKKPYNCPDCHYNFVNAKFLEIHLWTDCLHMLKKRLFACKICEIVGFRDIESITAHFVIMHSVTKIACEICYVICSSYNDYMKHYAETHTYMLKPKPVRLIMCKLNNKIVRCENFMSHLLKYPVIQEHTWYKCPFCTLVAQENKHAALIFSTHLRDKHLKRLSEVMSIEALSEPIFQMKLKEPGTKLGNLNKSATPLDRATQVIPKIVNTRTISSEIFERGSHDMDDTWFVRLASTFAVDDSSQIIQKGNTLPKILDVRSMADLKTTDVTTITKMPTENPTLEHNSQASQSEVIETMDEEEDRRKKAMEPDDIKSDIKEETQELEEPSKSNDDLISSYVTESKTTPQTDDFRTNLSTESITEISHSETIPSGRIKVIDIRKICKPNVEPFIDELCDTQSENENVASLPIPKPPPLARIPQYAIDYRRIEQDMYKRRNVAKSKYLSRKVAKMKRRIAIIGPTDTQEGCIGFLCHICNERIDTSWPVVRTHFAQNHSREYQLSMLALRIKKLPADFINHYTKLMSSSKKRKSDVTLPTTKKKRRWTPKKHAELKDTNAPEVGLCVNEETAEDGEGNFKCKKCAQRCTDMSDLREHIATDHRLKGRYLICLECGENFVVVPSLQMHLKAFHGIEDPISYMNQNPSYAPDANTLEVEGRTTVANQCYVCMAVFEDKAAVDKHLRVHGMAFLNRKRIEARNALKSPEKKLDTEGNKQSPVTEIPKETTRRDKPVETILEKLNVSR